MAHQFSCFSVSMGSEELALVRELIAEEMARVIREGAVLDAIESESGARDVLRDRIARLRRLSDSVECAEGMW